MSRRILQLLAFITAELCWHQKPAMLAMQDAKLHSPRAAIPEALLTWHQAAVGVPLKWIKVCLARKCGMLIQLM